MAPRATDSDTPPEGGKSPVGTFRALPQGSSLHWIVGANFGGRFQDNFVWEDGSEGLGQGTHNKGLFAENFGENRVFVRGQD